MHPSNNTAYDGRNSGRYDRSMKKPAGGPGRGYDYIEDRDAAPSRCSVATQRDYCIFGIFCSVFVVAILYSSGLLNVDNGPHNATNYSM